MDQEEMSTRPKPKASKAEEAVSKDTWDKIDIVGRAAIPIIVALSVLHWNSERTSRDTAAQMIAIATSVLTAPPDQSAPSALRSWAIAVLQSPDNPPLLTEAAAAALANETLPFRPWLNVDPEKFGAWLAPQSYVQTPRKSEADIPSNP